MKGYYKFIPDSKRAEIRDFLEKYWDNPDSDPDFVCAWLQDKGIIKLLEEIVRE